MVHRPVNGKVKRIIKLAKAYEKSNRDDFIHKMILSALKTYMVGDHHFAKTSLPLHARPQG
ncbi:MAG: hypothetical protein AB7S37_04645 [Methanobacteriales archaeon]|nr:hypothetical protein [Methanothermobacter sp.]